MHTKRMRKKTSVGEDEREGDGESKQVAVKKHSANFGLFVAYQVRLRDEEKTLNSMSTLVYEQKLELQAFLSASQL